MHVFYIYFSCLYHSLDSMKIYLNVLIYTFLCDQKYQPLSCIKLNCGSIIQNYSPMMQNYTPMMQNYLKEFLHTFLLVHYALFGKLVILCIILL